MRKLSSILSYVAMAISLAFCLYLCYNKLNNAESEIFYMDFWEIVAGIAPIATTIGALIISIINLCSKRADKFDTIKLLIGENKENLSISDQLGIKKGELSVADRIGIEKDGKSITGQIGIARDEKSLTGQHKEILEAITADKTEKEKLYSKFTKKQKNVAEKVDEINLFLKDWENLSTENGELLQKNEMFKNEIFQLKNQLNKLETQLNKSLKNEQKLQQALDESREPPDLEEEWER